MDETVNLDIPLYKGDQPRSDYIGAIVGAAMLDAAGVDIDGLISGVSILIVGSGFDYPIDERQAPVTSQGSDSLPRRKLLISAHEFRSADEWVAEEGAATPNGEPREKCSRRAVGRLETPKNIRAPGQVPQVSRRRRSTRYSELMLMQLAPEAGEAPTRSRPRQRCERRANRVTSSACREVAVFAKTAFRRLRAVSRAMPKASVMSSSAAPVASVVARRASAGVRPNICARRASGGTGRAVTSVMVRKRGGAGEGVREARADRQRLDEQRTTSWARDDRLARGDGVFTRRPKCRMRSRAATAMPRERVSPYMPN